MAITLVNSAPYGTNIPGADSTSVTLPIPTGSWTPSDGDMIVHCFGFGVNSSLPLGTVFLSDGRNWASTVCGCFYYRIFETGDTDDALTMSVSGRRAYVTFVIRPTSGFELHAEFASATASSGSADPPIVTPSGGTRDYLAIAMAAVDASSTPNLTAGPSGYSGVVTSGASGSVSGGTSVIVGADWKFLTGVSSENPGAFTNSSEQWTASTMMIWETAIATPGASTRAPTLGLLGVG